MRTTIRLYVWFFLVAALFAYPLNVFAQNGVEIHGYLSQGYLKSSANNYLADSEDGSFQFNEFGLNFQYFPGDKLSIGAQLGARDVGDIGNDEIGLNWAYGDYRWRDWLGFRGGITKSTFGLYFEGRDVDAVRTFVLLPQAIYTEAERDASEGLKGLSLYGNVDMGMAGMMFYDIKIADLQLDNESGVVKRMGESFYPIFSGAIYYINSLLPTPFALSSPLDIDVEVTGIEPSKFYGGRINWQTPLEGLLLSSSAVLTKDFSVTAEVSSDDASVATVIAAGGLNELTITVDESTRFFYGLEYTFQNLILAAEMAQSKTTTIINGTEYERESTSWYASISYRFLDWFEAGTYYSELINDDDGSGPENELKDICVTTRFDITPSMTLKFEVHSMDGLNNVNLGNDGTSDDSWMLYIANVSYNF